MKDKIQKNQEKVVICFHISRCFQALPSIPFVSWAFKESIAIKSKLFHALKLAVSDSRTWHILEIEYHYLGICSMNHVYILNLGSICKLLVTVNCVFSNPIEIWNCRVFCLVLGSPCTGKIGPKERHHDAHQAKANWSMTLGFI